ncbi:hypothetical protein [Neptunicella sp. SCSIO 80796]|uniref:hypothetical protein n=1 Tax=Neptunicella plasticusilytica TaxID=3117012 RepID=UPI003A4E57A8
MNQEKQHLTYYYGLKSRDHAITLADVVAHRLGYGINGFAARLLLETACAETQLGTYPDSTPNSGHGLCQFDQIGFDDVKARTRQADISTIKLFFDVDITQCSIEQLDNNPLLSFIFCRLKYKLIPNEIPDYLLGRAKYWKYHYNTWAGKGTVSHYLCSANRILYPGDS